MNLFLNANPAFPEILLLSGTVLILLIDLFLKGKKSLSFLLTEILLLAVLFCIIEERSIPMQMLYGGHYIFDSFGLLIKGICVLLTFFIIAYARVRDEFQDLRSEYLFLILFSLLGAMVLASSASLITLYLGLELVSLPVYALVALKRDCEKSGEAAIKYFVMGALASGFLLYGFSLLYGLTGSLWLPQIAVSLVNGLMSTTTFAVVAMMVIAAIAFKLGIVPFHMWIADVYEGSPLSTTAFLANVPKIAVIALFMRLFVETFTIYTMSMQIIMFVLGALSLLLGASGALMQKNLRRFLGYSTIANMGIVFIALGIGTAIGFANAIFYVSSYALTTVAFFGLLLILNRDLVAIDDLKGLHQTKPFTAFLFLILLLSLAGIPPLLGFDAKFLVLMALIHAQHIGVAIMMLALSVISAGYVLRIIKAIYFDRGEGDFTSTRSFGSVCVVINTFAVLALGIFPAGLMTMVNKVFM